jgi:hypothetical protein
MGNLISDATCAGTIYQPPTTCAQVESNWAMVAQILSELCSVVVQELSALPTFDATSHPTFTFIKVIGGDSYISDGSQWISVGGTGTSSNRLSSEEFVNLTTGNTITIVGSPLSDNFIVTRNGLEDTDYTYDSGTKTFTFTEIFAVPSGGGGTGENIKITYLITI